MRFPVYGLGIACGFEGLWASCLDTKEIIRTNTFKILFLWAVFAILATDSKYLEVASNILKNSVIRPLSNSKIVKSRNFL